MRLKAGMGALLASDKIDQTALRQGAALRLPETVGNIIFHPRPESRSFALAHKETRTGANQLLLASAKGQQRHLLTPLFCYLNPGQPCWMQERASSFYQQYLQVKSRKNQYVFKVITERSLPVRRTHTAMPLNKFIVATQSAWDALTEQLCHPCVSHTLCIS